MPLPILMYHQIDEPPSRGTPMRGLVVSPRMFRSHLALMRRLGLRGVSMPILTEALAQSGSVLRQRLVGITFDDGYRNNLIHALPALKAAGFSATCYAVSGHVGGSNTWDWGQGVPAAPLMSAEDLRAWADAGMDVGAHTHDHIDLTALRNLDDARRQIHGSKAALEGIIDRPVMHFCYPYGRFDDHHVDLVKLAGYATAVTVNRGRAEPGDDLHRLKRVLVSRSTHLGYMLLKLLTRYEDRRGH